jgi:hypothetical protein
MGFAGQGRSKQIKYRDGELASSLRLTDVARTVLSIEKLISATGKSKIARHGCVNTSGMKYRTIGKVVRNKILEHSTCSYSTLRFSNELRPGTYSSTRNRLSQTNSLKCQAPLLLAQGFTLLGKQLVFTG